jgi:uncharacterized protein YqgC (DUF456 family)
MNWVYYFILAVVLVLGWLANLFGLPGLWLMVAGLAGYAWATGWEVFVGWPSITALIALGLIAEVLEFAAGAAGSKAAGGRKRGMIGAVIGALLGGIFLSFIPVPIVSTIVGACLGAFIGAAVMEFYDRDIAHATRVGIGAAKGRFTGIVIKGSIGLVMLIIALAAALPLATSKPTPTAPPGPVLPPATVPSTAPTTQEKGL